MANIKATPTRIEWPPLLSLERNDIEVDPTMKKWDKVNGPCINGMLQPIYTKHKGYKSISDTEGNEYVFKNSTLYKNGEKLFHAENKHFVKTDVSEDFNKYLSYDVKSNGEVVYATFLDNDNSISIYNGNAFVNSGQLYEDGNIIATRVAYVNDSVVLFTVFNDNDTEKFLYMRLNDDGTEENVITGQMIWTQQTARANASLPISVSHPTIPNSNPIINITYVNGHYAVSAVSNYGFVLDSVRTAYWTGIEYNDALYNTGADTLTPQDASQSATVTTEHYAYFYVTTNRVSAEYNGTCLYYSGRYYDYIVEGEVGQEIVFPPTYTPTAKVGQVTISGITYEIFNYVALDWTLTLNVRFRNGEQGTLWHFEASVDNIQDLTTASTDNVQELIFTKRTYRGQDNPNIDSIDVVWDAYSNTPHNIPKSYWNNASFYVVETSTSTSSVSYIVFPNVFTDDGNMHALWKFTQNINAWSNGLQVGSYLVMGGKATSLTIDGAVLKYSFSADSIHNVTSQGAYARSNSFCVGQNFFASFTKLNSSAAATPKAVIDSAAKDPTTATYVEFMYSKDTGIKYFPGSVRASSGSVTTYWNYYSKYMDAESEQGEGNEDALCWTTGGYRVQVRNTKWNILFNTLSSGSSIAQGISYSDNASAMGTLVSPWSSLAEDTYVVGNDNFMIYKDLSGRTYKISIEDDVIMSALLDDRYILLNTTSFWNMYDSVTYRKLHYATDYNRRTYYGQKTPTYMDCSSPRIRSMASALNAAYNVAPRTAVAGILLARSTLWRVLTTEIKSYDVISPEDKDVQPIDIYYSILGDTSTSNLACNYRFSIYPYNQAVVTSRFELVGTSYVTALSTQGVSPNIFTEYVNGQGNNDMAVENNVAYVLKYNLNQEPLFLYSGSSASSITQTSTSGNGGSSSTDESSKTDVINFFVLQGQFYGCINNKIYSLVYNNGVISSQEAIVDIRGLQFVGNTPAIAFFWSPVLRAMYSFTGDAQLNHIYHANKFDKVLLNKRQTFYDESTQSIFIPTDAGLFIIGPKNHYIIEEWKDVSYCQFSSDGISHVTNGDETIDFVYYPTDGYEAMPLDLKTCLYGSGSNNVGSIDRWSIRLFDYNMERPETYITVGTETLTDIGVKSDEKTFTIKPSMWDKLSNSILVNYNPQKIEGTGVRLFIKTPMMIESITPSVQQRAQSTLSRHNV